MFKIIKKETYNNLNQTIENQEYRISSLEIRLSNEKKNVYDSLTNFNTRIILLGERGSGKTTFLKDKILKSIRSHLVIDTLNSFPNSFRYLANHENGIDKKEIIELIKFNSDKTIVIDDIEMLSQNSWLLEKLIYGDYNFVIVVNNMETIKNYLKDVDYIYQFGTFRDLKDDFYLNRHSKKVIKIDKTN